MPAGQGREIRPGPAASAVNLVAAIAARPLGMEEHPLAGRRVGRATQLSQPGVDVMSPELELDRAAIEPAAPQFARKSTSSSAAASSRLDRAKHGPLIFGQRDPSQAAKGFMPQRRLFTGRQSQQPFALRGRVVGQAGDRLGADRQRRTVIAGQLGQDLKSPAARALAQASHGFDPDGLAVDCSASDASGRA